MVYRFKVWFENNEDVVRWIDLKPSQTFLDFHKVILDSVSFDQKELSSFYISDGQWKRHFEIMMEDMTQDDSDEALPVILLKDAKLRDYINDPHQRFIFVYDYLANWTFHCELISIEETKTTLNYPAVIKSEGIAPRQREDNKFKLLDDNEFDELAAKILASKGIQNELTAEFGGLEVADNENSDDDDEFSDSENDLSEESDF